MLKLRQARGTFNKGLSALSAFSRNETIFFSKDAVPALPCPGALACRPAVRHSQRLEPSPSSFRLSSRQNLSLRHQSSSSPGTFCQSLGGEGWDTLTMGPCFLVFSTIQGKTRAKHLLSLCSEAVQSLQSSPYTRPAHVAESGPRVRLQVLQNSGSRMFMLRIKTLSSRDRHWRNQRKRKRNVESAAI